MLDDAWKELQGYFYAKPLLLVVIGRWLATAGALAIIAGLAGRVAGVGTSVIYSRQAAESLPTLESIYPGYWLWWVPESIIGALPYALMVAAGAWLVSRGRMIHRVY
jgi:hypothetical protein